MNQRLGQQSQCLDEIQATQRIFFQYGQERFAEQFRLLESIANRATEHRNLLQPEADYAQQARLLERSSSSASRTGLNHTIISVRARIAPGSVAGDQRPICTPSCRCSCHTSGSFRTPWLFNKTLGSLFIGYSGFPFAIRKCKDETCQSAFSARITYTFPLWLLWKMIDICSTASKVQDPFFSLTVRARVAASAEIFRLTGLDDRFGLERLFSSGGARPNDVRWNDGDTALRVCFRFLFCKNLDPCSSII